MSIDPYSPPTLNVHAAKSAPDTGVSQGVLAQLAGTKPWVRFMSVLMFVGAGFMLLGALVLLLMGGMIAESAKGVAMPPGLMAGIAVLYAALSILYIYPALKLWKYANGIAALLISGNSVDLEVALSQQRSFWKFLGIMVIICFVLYFFAILGMIAVGGFAAMKAQGA